MLAYVVFLRAINLGARRKFGKDDVARVTRAAGFEGVATHLNTGNVLVLHPSASRAEVEAVLERAYEADRGFEVPCIAFTPEELARVVADGRDCAREWSEAGRGELVRHTVYLLGESLPPESAAALEALSAEAGVVAVRGRAAHVLLGEGYVAGRTDPLGVARRLPLTTNRTQQVLASLVTKWSDAGS